MRTPEIARSAATTDVLVIDGDRLVPDVLAELLTRQPFLVPFPEESEG